MTTPGPARGPMSIRGYARARGVSAPSVLKAIKSERLIASVAWDANGTPQIADPDLADQEWDANTDHSRAPGYVKNREAVRAGLIPPSVPPPPDIHVPATTAGAAPGSMSLAAAAALLQEWKAKLAELDYKTKAGQLIDAAEVEAKLGEMIIRCRTRLLGLPSKMKTQIPVLTRQDMVKIDAIVREALEELATLTPDDDGPDVAPPVQTCEARQ